MKKLIALLMIVSFITVSTAGAFANPIDFERNRAMSKRIERKQDRKPAINRQAPARRNEISRQNRPNRLELGKRPIIRGAIRPNNSPNRYQYQRPITRPNGSFFNRAARSYPSLRNHSRPYPSYRPSYRHSRSSSSMSALEFLGIGAAIISLVAIISNSTNNYDY